MPQNVKTSKHIWKFVGNKVWRATRAIPWGRIQKRQGVWDPIPELTTTSPYVHSRVDSNTFIMGNPMPESTLTLCQSWIYPPVRDFGFGLCIFRLYSKIAEKIRAFLFSYLNRKQKFWNYMHTYRNTALIAPIHFVRLSQQEIFCFYPNLYNIYVDRSTNQKPLAVLILI